MVYRTTKYGMVGDGKTSCSAALETLMESVPDGSTIFFPAGTYFFDRHVNIRNKKKLTICGEDATLMTHFAPCGTKEENNDLFRFEGCDDLSMHDFIITTDNPIGMAGRVVAIDEAARTYDVRVFDEFPMTGEEHLWGNNTCDEEGMPDYVLSAYEPITEKTVTDPDGTERKLLVGTIYDLLPNNTIRVHLKDYQGMKGLHIGHLVNFRYYIYGNSHLKMADCNRVEFKNLDFYRCTSMALVVSPRCSDLTLDHFNIRVAPGSRELYAANADGIHILGLCGYLRIKHSEFNGLGDDILNIHGTAGEITEVLPDGRLKMEHRHRGGFSPLQGNWALPGDVVAVYDSKTFVQKGTLTIGAFDNGVATVKESTGTYAVGDALANTVYFAKTHISDCICKNTRARGLLLQTHNILVENCYFNGFSLPGILISPDIRYWYEVGPSAHVTIRNNVFDKCAYIRAVQNRGAIAVLSCHDSQPGDYPAGVHRDIHIVGNTFHHTGNSAVFVSATDGVEIRDNIFDECCCHRYNARAYDVRHDIVTWNSRNITLSGNKTTQKEKNLFYAKNCKNIKQQ